MDALKLLEQFGPFAILLAIVIVAVYKKLNKDHKEQVKELNVQIASLVQTVKAKDDQLKDSYNDRIASAEHTTAVGAAMTTAMEENGKVGIQLCKDISELKSQVLEQKSSLAILIDRTEK